MKLDRSSEGSEEQRLRQLSVQSKEGKKQKVKKEKMAANVAVQKVKEETDFIGEVLEVGVLRKLFRIPKETKKLYCRKEDKIEEDDYPLIFDLAAEGLRAALQRNQIEEEWFQHHQEPVSTWASLYRSRAWVRRELREAEREAMRETLEVAARMPPPSEPIEMEVEVFESLCNDPTCATCHSHV